MHPASTPSSCLASCPSPSCSLSHKKNLPLERNIFLHPEMDNPAPRSSPQMSGNLPLLWMWTNLNSLQGEFTDHTCCRNQHSRGLAFCQCRMLVTAKTVLNVFHEHKCVKDPASERAGGPHQDQAEFPGPSGQVLGATGLVLVILVLLLRVTSS